MSIPVNVPVATDFGQLNALQTAAANKDPKAIREAARQFEALFTEMLLKTADQTKFGDDLTGQQGDFYKDLFNQQMALTLSSGKGLGLADMLVRELSGGKGGAAPGATASSSMTRTNSASAGTSSAKIADIDDPAWKPDSPEAFVAAIRPQAEKAAAQLGVPARALIAQAALETGWGQKVGQTAAGCSSFNLFNIKAGANWSGATSTHATGEFEGGDWTTEGASFRAYPSVGAAFNDYVSFLKNNPRYADALDRGDIQGFAQALQNAGYATDPQYADKLVRVACSVQMSSAMGASQVSV